MKIGTQNTTMNQIAAMSCALYVNSMMFSTGQNDQYRARMTRRAMVTLPCPQLGIAGIHDVL